MWVKFIDVNGEGFGVDYEYLRGIPVIDGLQNLEGETEIQLKTTKFLFMITVAQNIVNNLAQEETDQVKELTDFLGIDNYSRFEGDEIISELSSIKTYRKHLSLDELRELSPEEYRGVLLEAIFVKDTDLLDQTFVEEFKDLLKINPYLFVHTNTYWVYENYADEIKVNENLKVVVKIMFDSYFDDKLGEILGLRPNSQLIYLLWKDLGKQSYDGSLVVDILNTYDDEEAKSLIKRMIDSGLDINDVNERNENCLIQLANDGIYGLDVLLDLGADPNQIDIKGHSFLYYLIKEVNSFHYMFEERDVNDKLWNGLQSHKSRLTSIANRSDIQHALSKKERLSKDFLTTSEFKKLADFISHLSS